MVALQAARVKLAVLLEDLPRLLDILAALAAVYIVPGGRINLAVVVAQQVTLEMEEQVGRMQMDLMELVMGQAAAAAVKALRTVILAEAAAAHIHGVTFIITVLVIMGVIIEVSPVLLGTLMATQAAKVKSMALHNHTQVLHHLVGGIQ
jgi:hypothetical protein